MNSSASPGTIRGSWGTGVWQDAMHYPGSRQVALGRRLLEQVRWWRLRPAVAKHVVDAGRRSAFGATSDDVAVYYLASEFVSEEWRGVKGLAIDVAGRDGFQASWVDPRTLREHPIGPVVADPTGRWDVPPTPSMEDWLLVVHTQPGVSG